MLSNFLAVFLQALLLEKNALRMIFFGPKIVCGFPLGGGINQRR